MDIHASFEGFFRCVIQVWEIEKELGLGQVEELIEEAKGELVLIPEYASWKYWDVSRVTSGPDSCSTNLVSGCCHRSCDMTAHLPCSPLFFSPA